MEAAGAEAEQAWGLEDQGASGGRERGPSTETTPSGTGTKKAALAEAGSNDRDPGAFSGDFIS